MMLAPSPSQRLPKPAVSLGGAPKAKVKALPTTIESSAPTAAVPFVPQYVKNQQMNKKLQDLEESLANELRNAEQQADYNVERYTAFIASKYALDGLEDELLAAKDEAAKELERSQAVKNDLVTRLKLELDLKERNFKAYYPEWMRFLMLIHDVVKEFGYSNRTRWRSRVGTLLESAASSFYAVHGTSNSQTGSFRALSAGFNSFSPSALVLAVNDLADEAGDAEGERDPTFHLIRLEYRQARNAWQKASEQRAWRAEPVVNAANETERIRREAEWHRENLGISKVGTGILPQITNINNNTSSTKSGKLAPSTHSASTRGFDSPTSEAPTLAVADALVVAFRLPMTKSNEASLDGSYKSIFATCASIGDWAGAIACYSQYTSHGFVPDKFAFQCIIGACKRATPPEVDRAVLVLDEMNRQGVPVGVEHYNAVIDTCRVGGALRRGLQVFEKMTGRNGGKSGCAPNTNTYALLAKLGNEAKADEAPEIYEALKFAGVPEYIAYTAAASNVMRGAGIGDTKRVLARKQERALIKGLKFVEVPVEKTAEEVLDDSEERERRRAMMLEKAVEGIFACTTTRNNAAKSGGGKGREEGGSHNLC